MAVIDPPSSTLDPHAMTRVDAVAREQPKPKTNAAAGPAAKAAAERRAAQAAETDAKMLPDKLVVEKDQLAGRFVQFVLDAQTQEVKSRYPSETQLAFSRAVAAYARAMSES